jgi:uridylate kinase
MYQRVILKLSGEALKGNGTYGIHPITVKGIAQKLRKFMN